jgi:hypothetical protein
VILDFLKDGLSVFSDPSDRPTILEGEKSVLVRLTNTVQIHPHNVLSINVEQIGSQEPGEDLLIQVRYAYMEIFQTGLQMRYEKAAMAIGNGRASADPDLVSSVIARAVGRTQASGGHLIRPVSIAGKSTGREGSAAIATVE